MNEIYVGWMTAHYLQRMQEGVLSRTGLELRLKIENQTRNYSGVFHLSVQEALTIVRQKPLTPREIIAVIQEYQRDLADIDQLPEQWVSTHLSIEQARGWYLQQIALLRQKIQCEVQP